MDPYFKGEIRQGKNIEYRGSEEQSLQDYRLFNINKSSLAKSIKLSKLEFQTQDINKKSSLYKPPSVYKHNNLSLSQHLDEKLPTITESISFFEDKRHQLGNADTHQHGHYSELVDSERRLLEDIKEEHEEHKESNNSDSKFNSSLIIIIDI